ncbi:unnamed protein product, partial [Scytosiphon promiscuus]
TDVPAKKRKQRRYKFRKREVTRRQVFNVTAEETQPRRSTRKIIPYDMGSHSVPMKRKRPSRGRASGGAGGNSGGGRRRRSRRGIRRSHFDSSSESSDGGGGGGGFADHDQGFERYQRKTHERELGSIQPINSFG